jgi:hypothetical protein
MRSSKTCGGQTNRLAEARTSIADTLCADGFRWHESCLRGVVMLDIRW